MMLSIRQYSEVHPGSLVPMDGKCNSFTQYGSVVNERILTAIECLQWCVIANVETQTEMAACQFFDPSSHDSPDLHQHPECRAFPIASFTTDAIGTIHADGHTCWGLLTVIDNDSNGPSDDHNNDNINNDSGSSKERHTRGMVTATMLWPEATVFYEIILPSSPDSWAACGIDQAVATQNVLLGISHYHTHTHVKFVERTTQPNYVRIGCHSRPTRCASRVGHTGKIQKIFVGHCWDKVGSIIHELGHTVGLWHEHTRGTYVDVCFSPYLSR